MSYQALDELSEINYRINQCPYKADPPNFDDWRPGPDGAPKDCDSYAVGKLRTLVKRGWRIEQLRLACCYVETGDYHCVLIVSMNDGDYMLDNRQEYPVPIGDLPKLGYKPDRIQAIGGQWKWAEWRQSERPVREIYA